MSTFLSKRTQFLIPLFLTFATAVLGLNFTVCQQKLKKTGEDYRWKGPVCGLKDNRNENRSLYYKYEGCEEECGGGFELNEWQKMAETITTWIFPTVGLLLQAPYESNTAVWRNVYQTVRWVGSPVASLTCTLWNISVSLPHF
jgi:hypothetical protein